jgi:hypothetical protein
MISKMVTPRRCRGSRSGCSLRGIPTGRSEALRQADTKAPCDRRVAVILRLLTARGARYRSCFGARGGRMLASMSENDARAETPPLDWIGLGMSGLLRLAR